MIASTTLSIEKHFSDNWVGEVNYNQPHYKAKAPEWIEIIVAPVSSDNVAIDGCTLEAYDLQVLSYGSNKVKAGKQLDTAIAFLQNTNIDEVRVKTWRTIANGLFDDSYFYKISFDIQS